jgi:hypothetical protein
VVVKYFQVNRHHIATQGISDLSDTVGILDHAYIPWISKMIHNRFVVHLAPLSPMNISNYLRISVPGREKHSMLQQIQPWVNTFDLGDFNFEIFS